MQILEQSFHDSLVQQLKDQLTKEVNEWFNKLIEEMDTLLYWNNDSSKMETNGRTNDNQSNRDGVKSTINMI